MRFPRFIRAPLNAHTSLWWFLIKLVENRVGQVKQGRMVFGG